MNKIRVSVSQIINFFYPFSTKPRRERVVEGKESEKKILTLIPNYNNIIYQHKVEREFKNAIIVGVIDFYDPIKNIIYEAKLGIPNIKHLPIKYLKRVQLQANLYDWLLGRNSKLKLIIIHKKYDINYDREYYSISIHNLRKIDVINFLEKYFNASLINYINC